MGIKQAGTFWGRKPLSRSNSERPVGDREKGLGQRAAGREGASDSREKEASRSRGLCSPLPPHPTPPLQAVATLCKPGRCHGHTAALWQGTVVPGSWQGHPSIVCSSPLALRSMGRCKRPRCDANHSNFLLLLVLV